MVTSTFQNTDVEGRKTAKAILHVLWAGRRHGLSANDDRAKRYALAG